MVQSDGKGDGKILETVGIFERIAPFFLGSFLEWMPRIFWGLLFLRAAYRHIFRRAEVSYRRLAALGAAFPFFYAALLTAAQFWAWSQGVLTRFLLRSPLDAAVPLPSWLREAAFLNGSLGYFFFYSYGRFWINPLLGVATAALFFFFLKSLKRREGRFFEAGEVELGFLAALVAGWPGFLIFLPLSFGFVVIISLVRLVAFGERYTTLGYSFLAAALSVFLFGDKILAFLHWEALRM